MNPSGGKSDFEKAALFWNETNLGEIRSCIQTYLYLALMGPHREGQLLERFVEHLGEDDSVMTFNYDLVVERALFQRGLWNPEDGYGFSFEKFPEVGSGQDFVTKVPIFKLHGSLNWTGYGFGQPKAEQVFFYDDGSPIFAGYLKDDTPPLSREVYQGKHGGIWMMPSFVKEFAVPEFLTVWDHAAKALRGAERIVIVGYSLPEADSAACVLLGTNGPAARRVTLVNPSAGELREKYERITGNKSIETCRSIEEFLERDE